MRLGCCCGEAAICTCTHCQGNNTCCLNITIADAANLDPSENVDVCWHCPQFNGTWSAGYVGSCTWQGGFCSINEGDFYGKCGVDYFRCRIARTGTVGSYSYKFIVEFIDIAPFSLTHVVVASWEYDYGNLGSELIDCEALTLTCDLVINDLDCTLPETITVAPKTGTCTTLANTDDCLNCEVIDVEHNPLNSSLTNDDWAGYAPRIFKIRFSGVVTPDDQCPPCCDGEQCNCAEIHPDIVCSECSDLCDDVPDCNFYCDCETWDGPNCIACMYAYLPCVAEYESICAEFGYESAECLAAANECFACYYEREAAAACYAEALETYELCQDCYCEDCGTAPCGGGGCTSCVATCNALGWGHASCIGCWTSCGQPDCRLTYKAWLDECAAYDTCIDTCEECQECQPCDCDLFNRTFRAVGGGDAGNSYCFWDWQAVTVKDPAICSLSMNISKIRFQLELCGEGGSPYDICAKVIIYKAGSPIVTWTKTLCSDCSASYVSSFNCLDWVGESDGWTIDIVDEATDICDWESLSLSVTPEPFTVPCLRRKVPCGNDGNEPWFCENAESGYTQYLKVTIPTGHWYSAGCITGSCDFCDLAEGEFILELQNGVSGCTWAYQIDDPASPPCTGDIDSACIPQFIKAGFSDTGTEVQFYVLVENSMHIVSWLLEIPYKYGEDGAKVIDCMIDEDIPYCRQSGFLNAGNICQWGGSHGNLGACGVHSAPDVHAEMITL